MAQVPAGSTQCGAVEVFTVARDPSKVEARVRFPPAAPKRWLVVQGEDAAL